MGNKRLNQDIEKANQVQVDPEKVYKGLKSSSYANKDHFLLKKIYKENHPDTSCLVEYEASEVSHNQLTELIRFTKRRKRKLKSVDTLPSNIPHFNIGTNMNQRGRVSPNEKTGLFRLNIQDGNKMRYIYLIKRLIGYGKNSFVQSLYCSDYETQKIFLRLKKQTKKASGKPKVGIFEGVTQQNAGGGAYLVYKSLNVPSPPIMHQNSVKVTNSVEKYFANKERYLRNGKSGTKRVLMYGNAGSGKTTLAYHIAKKYEKTHCVLFATDVLAISLHSKLCARYKIPTIIIAEECDKWMGSVDHEGRADGNVKAFLDGYMSHRNTSGEFSLLITNYPEKIEKTIMFRPGRIHERIKIGALDAEHAVRVASLYFKNERGKTLCPIRELNFLGDMKLTGAQIENLATMCVDEVNGSTRKITEKLIRKIISEFGEAISDVKSYTDDKTLVESSWIKNIGFTPIESD